MKQEWTETRPNGQAITPGTFALKMDLEDGTNPIYVYGRTKEEVIEKVARQNMHAQRALSDRPRAGATSNTPQPAPVAPAARAPLSPDDTMRAVKDLENPAKAGEAVATLLESATGVDPRRLAMENFANVAERWQNNTPDFYVHPGNQQLLIQRALAYPGVERHFARITPEILTYCFQQIRAEGKYFERPAEVDNDNPPHPTPAFPGQNQVPRAPEQQRETRFSTGTRSTRFATPVPGSQKRTPKYTAEQIRTMPYRQAEELTRSNDPDYAFACEYHFGNQAASA